jgi:acetate kinase
MHLDDALNTAAPSDTPTRISSTLAGREIRVIPTDEERQMAREVFQFLPQT